MADETVIVRGTGTIFLGGPPLVKAATGEEVTAEELGGGDVHARISGVADHLAVSDEHALALLRESSGCRAAAPRRGSAPTPRSRRTTPTSCSASCRPSPGGPTTCARCWRASSTAPTCTSSSRSTAETLVCGFARIWGYPIAVLASNGILFSQSALKGAHFVQLACQRRIPLLFLQNISGFMVGREYEHGGIAKDGAKLVTAVACAQVPRFTVIVGGSFGAGNYGMCGRAYSPRLLFTWPGARISVMGARQAAETLLTVRLERGDELSEEEREAFRAPILAKYEQEGNPLYATARLWDDGILDPLDTRRALALGLAASTRAPVGEPRFGIFRM